MPLDCFSWLAKANLAAFSCSLANLFSYLETFFRVGLMNLPFMSLTEMVSSLIWRSRRMTSRCRKKHLTLEAVPLVEVLLADLLQVVHGGGAKVGLGATPLGDHPQPLLCLPLLLLLQLLRGLLPEQGPQLLLPLGGHESLLLGHGDGVLLPVLDGDESLAQFPRHWPAPMSGYRADLGKARRQ